MNITLDIPDELYRRVAEVAADGNVTIDRLLVSALEEWLVQFDRLKQRAARGSREEFLQVMAKVPDVEPPEYDVL